MQNQIEQLKKQLEEQLQINKDLRVRNAELAMGKQRMLVKYGKEEAELCFREFYQKQDGRDESEVAMTFIKNDERN